MRRQRLPMLCATAALLLLWLLPQEAACISIHDFRAKCESAFCNVLAAKLREVDPLAQAVSRGECVQNLGGVCSEVVHSARSALKEQAAAGVGDEEVVLSSDEMRSTLAEKEQLLERALDGALRAVYLKQLSNLRERALQTFRAGITATSHYEGLTAAEEEFTKGAEEATRPGSGWEFAQEKKSLQTIMNEVAARIRKVHEVQTKAAQENAAAMQFLQAQQQQLQAIQQQLYSGGSRLNFAAAYRIPDTDINVQAMFAQGKTNVQVTCVPDESVGVLGPNGFVHGVGPGNLGLSANINL